MKIVSKPLNNTNIRRKVNGLSKRLLASGVFVLMTMGQSAYADIYKVTKPNGEVVFTDHASNIASANIEKLKIPSYSSTASNTSNQRRSQNNTAPTPDSNTLNSTNSLELEAPIEDEQVNYRLEIMSPSEERAYHKPAQQVDVAVNVSPALNAGDNIIIMVDNKQVATGTTASIPTVSLLPGKHTLQTMVQYKNGQTAAKQSRVFYIIQTAVANR